MKPAPFIILLLASFHQLLAGDFSVAPLLAAIDKQTGKPRAGFLEQVDELFFHEDLLWKQVANGCTQYKFYATTIIWLGKQHPQTLERIMHRLNELQLGVEIEIGAAKGFKMVNESILLPVIRAGGRIDRLVIDNEFVKAHYRFRDRYNWSYEETVEKYADFVHELKHAYPDVHVGMIEAVFAHYWADPEKYPAQKTKPPRMDLRKILLDVQAACVERGVRLDSFVAEYSYSRINILPNGWDCLKQIRQFCTEQEMQFGIIYEDHEGGFNSDALFAENTLKMVKAFDEYELNPDFETVQSWFEHPLRILPETDPVSFMGVAKSIIEYKNSQ